MFYTSRNSITIFQNQEFQAWSWWNELISHETAAIDLLKFKCARILGIDSAAKARGTPGYAQVRQQAL